MLMIKQRRFFMRLLRGSRLRHLSAMQTVNAFGDGELIRPFLTYSKKSYLIFFILKMTAIAL